MGFKNEISHHLWNEGRWSTFYEDGVPHQGFINVGYKWYKSQPVDLDVPPMSSPTPNNFLSFPKSTKVKGSDLHKIDIIAHTLTSNLGYTTKIIHYEVKWEL